MACSINLVAINGIVQPGQADPGTIRVLGTASQCTSGQVLVSSPSATASQTVPVDANGRFRAELTLSPAAAIHCGSTVAVHAECVGQPVCAADVQRALPCCEIAQLLFQAVTLPGALAPAQMSVSGAVYGCPTDQVIISSTVTATTGPISVDPNTGAFSALIPLTSPVQCDDSIAVTAACASAMGCSRTVRGRLGCPDCYRAAVTIDASAPCTGNPQVKPITLNASIAIAASAIHDFHWTFGDGSSGPNFTVDNTGGTAATVHAHADTHNYAPGTYTATLRINPPPFECAEVTVTVVAQCTSSSCPTVTVDPPQISGQCTNGKRTVTLVSHITSPAGTTVFAQWDYGDGTVGGGIVGSPGSTVNTTQTHDYAPGNYTATLNILSPTGCPPVSVPLTIQPCGTPPCTLVVQGITVQIGPCDPATGMRTVTATGSVNNNDPADLYYWQWDSNPALVGLPAAQGTTQQHNYAAPGSGQSTYNITLTVIRSATCVSSMTRTISIDGCGAGCPAISGTVIDPSGPCTQDRLRRVVTLDATVNGTGVTQFVWSCGDGTSITLPGSAGPQTTHEYAPGTYTVTLTVTGPGNCMTTATAQITVKACCPEVTDIDVAPGTCASGAASRPVGLTAQVAGLGATSFDWDFGDGSPAATSSTPVAPAHSYSAPGTYTASVTAHTPNCPDVSATKMFMVAGCGGGGGTGLPACAALLWVSLILMLIGAIVSIVGCILANWFPQAGLVVGIVGVAIFALGAILFLIWWIVCRFLTLCAVILAARAFVMVLIAVFAVIAIVIAIFAFFNQAFWPCAAAATVYGFAWGGILAMLDFIAQSVGCITLNPSGGSSASSSSGLSSSGGSMRSRAPDFPQNAMRPRASDFSQKMSRGPAGLGDVVSSVTSAMGIQPCGGCQQRAERLNQAFPLTAPSSLQDR